MYERLRNRSAHPLVPDDVSRADIESIVRQRQLRLPVPSSGKVGQALSTSAQSNGGNGGNRTNRKTRNNSRISNSSNSSNNSSNNPTRQAIPPTAYHLVQGRCIFCLEPGYRWRECPAYIPPAPARAYDAGGANNEQHNDDEDVCCLASVLLRTGDGPRTEDPDENTSDKVDCR